MPYVFPGITVFFDRAAAAYGAMCPDVLHKSRSGWHVKAIVDAIGQSAGMLERVEAGQAPACSVTEAFERIGEIRDGLALQLAAIDAAVADVRSGLGLDPAPTSKKKVVNRARN